MMSLTPFTNAITVGSEDAQNTVNGIGVLLRSDWSLVPHRHSRCFTRARKVPLLRNQVGSGEAGNTSRGYMLSR